MNEDLRDLPWFPPLTVALAAGALWGGLGYVVLWGHTPLVLSRRFVVGPWGTVLLLPVRIVLWSLRWVEGLADTTFLFADTNWWIGVAAAAVGAGIASVVLAVGRRAKHTLRPAS